MEMMKRKCITLDQINDGLTVEGWDTEVDLADTELADPAMEEIRRAYIDECDERGIDPEPTPEALAEVDRMVDDLAEEEKVQRCGTRGDAPPSPSSHDVPMNNHAIRDPRTGKFVPAPPEGVPDGWAHSRECQAEMDAESDRHRKMMNDVKRRIGLPEDPPRPDVRDHLVVEKSIVPEIEWPDAEPKPRSDPRPDLPSDPVARLKARQRERDASIRRKQRVGGKFERYKS